MTLPSAYGNMVYKMRNEKEIEMTYEECLEFCTKRMAVMGYFPHEIAATANYVYLNTDHLTLNDEMEEGCI